MQKPFIELPVSLIKYQPPMPVTSQQALKSIKSDNVPQGKASVRDLLNVLLPPRTVTIQRKDQLQPITYVQYVQGDKLKREDVDTLKQKLEGFLVVRKARDRPICPIRQKIFAQAFDQIVRQVLIDCPQRGVMLNRVKNELMLTVTAYRTLYEESLTLSMSKVSTEQNDLRLLEQQQKQLIEKQQKLRENEIYLQSKKQSLEQKAREIKTIYKQKRQHEVKELKLQQEGLARFLTQMGKMPGTGEEGQEDQGEKQNQKKTDTEEDG